MKKAYKPLPARLPVKPLPIWTGQPVVVKLNDWQEFCESNHLRAVSSEGVYDDNGNFVRVIVRVTAA